MSDLGMSSKVISADLDSDGDADVIVGNFGFPNAVYMNSGNGELSKAAAGDMCTLFCD